MDEGTMPVLRFPRTGFRRLPLPGAGDRRRCRGDRPKLRTFAAACPDAGTGRTGRGRTGDRRMSIAAGRQRKRLFPFQLTERRGRIARIVVVEQRPASALRLADLRHGLGDRHAGGDQAARVVRELQSGSAVRRPAPAATAPAGPCPGTTILRRQLPPDAAVPTASRAGCRPAPAHAAGRPGRRRTARRSSRSSNGQVAVGVAGGAPRRQPQSPVAKIEGHLIRHQQRRRDDADLLDRFGPRTSRNECR